MSFIYYLIIGWKSKNQKHFSWQNWDREVEMGRKDNGSLGTRKGFVRIQLSSYQMLKHSISEIYQEENATNTIETYKGSSSVRRLSMYMRNSQMQNHHAKGIAIFALKKDKPF